MASDQSPPRTVVRVTHAVLAGLVAVSGIVSANLWRELREERRLNADLHFQLTEARMLAHTAAPVEPPVYAPPPPAITTNAVPDARSVEPPPARVPPRTVPAPQFIQRPDPLLDAEYRKARLTEQRLRVQRTLPGLVEELGISEEEAERLFDLLARNQLNRESASRVTVGADGQLDRDASLLRQQELQRQQEESLADLLGPTRYTLWQQYQQTLRPRMDAMTMGTQLAQMGQPLNTAQQKSLTTALIAEDVRTRDERERLARSINPGDLQAMALLQEEAAQLQEESNRRILETVGSSLDARQVETLRKDFEMKIAMGRANSNLQRGR